MNLIKNIVVFLIANFCYSSATADWELIGPADASVSSIFFDNNYIYAGGKGIVNLSINKGRSWIPLNNIGRLTFDYIYDIIVNDNKIFVGTMKGLFTSLDNGASWMLDSINGQVSVIWDIQKRDNDLFIVSGGNLYYSKDNGINWIQLTDNTYPALQKLEVDGENIYAGGTGFIDQPNFIMSHDNGNSWKIIKDTLSGLKTEAITSIASNGNYIFLGCKETELLISSDAGETWSKHNSELLKLSPINDLLCYKDTIFAGNEFGLFYSADSGKTWRSTTFQLPTRQIIKNNNEFL